MAKITDLSGRPHSGLVQSTVVGIVTDNVDPDELGRIQVKFPTLHNEPLSFWVRQASPMAGKDRGFYALPEKDDEVMVQFMQGSQDVGVIVGQFWNGVDKPPTEAKDGLPGPAKTELQGGAGTLSGDTFTDGSKDLSNNDRRFWRSRSGHLFVFDDTGGAETIQIWDKSHTLSLVFETTDQRIILANTGKDIHIRTQQDLIIEAGRDIKWLAGRNIEGESKQDTTHTVGKDYTVDTAMNTTLKTGQQFTAESTSSNMNLKAAMNTTIEGGIGFTAKGGTTATLQGGAMAEVKAGVVKIN